MEDKKIWRHNSLYKQNTKKMNRRKTACSSSPRKEAKKSLRITEAGFLLLLNLISSSSQSYPTWNRGISKEKSVRFLDNPLVHRRSTCKKYRSLISYFFKAFSSIYRGKMEQILLRYCLSSQKKPPTKKKTVTALMMLYKNMKAMVYSPDVDTVVFDIVTVVLLRDTLAPCMYIIC